MSRHISAGNPEAHNPRDANSFTLSVAPAHYFKIR